MAEVTYFDHRFDHFWHSQARAFQVAVIRDSGYLNWRYVHGPTPYKVFSVETENERSIKGFIVLGCYRQDVMRGRIVDILTENGDKEVIELLVTKAVNYFIEQKVDVITCWMLEHWPIFDMLKRKGFVLRETPHDLMVRSYVTEPAIEYLTDKSKWYMTMGDSDYY